MNDLENDAGSMVDVFDAQDAVGSPDIVLPESLSQEFTGTADLAASAGDVMSSIMDTLGFNTEDVSFPWSPPENVDGTPASFVVGEPDDGVPYWEPQTTGFTCAVQAQRGIIEAITGEDVSESQLVYEATVNGWLTDAGMSPSDVGKLLELHNIPCHSAVDASVGDLIRELAQGNKVIVGVDSGELWGDDFPLEDFVSQSSDHAVWVTKVDFSDPDNPTVAINDSGDPAGAGKVYELNDFVDAWEDSGFFYVTTGIDATASGNLVGASMIGGSMPENSTDMFGELMSWLSNKVEGCWDYLNSDTGHKEMAETTETIAIGAGLLFALDQLLDNAGEVKQDLFSGLSDQQTQQLFELV
jgi:hypothetical protein